MRFVRLLTYITSCLSVAHALSVTVGTPTQCGPLTVSWTGKHIVNTLDTLPLNSIGIVRWASTISDTLSSRLSSLSSQVHRILIFMLFRHSKCIRIILYHHQPSAMAKALIPYRNCRCRQEYNFYSLCLTPPDLVRVLRQTN